MFQKRYRRKVSTTVHNIARENNYSLLDATRHALVQPCENTRKLGRFLDMLEIWRDVGFPVRKTMLILLNKS